MSFDGNGNYSLPPGYLAVAGQTILPSQHNPPLEDIAAALSQTFLRSGVAPMMGALNANGFAIDNLPEGSGDQPVTFNQLQAILGTSGMVPTGSVIMMRGTIAPAGYVAENGGTIGSSTSGATTRANSDTQALFTYLWTNFSNSVLEIQTSAGAATSRGASAADDFAANKRMPLFDSRTRFPRGWDGGVGYDATLTVGATQADAIKNHVHPGTTANAGNHDHDMQGNFGSSLGSGSFRVGRVDGGSDTTTDIPILDDGIHNHTFTTDNNTGGIALETRPRSSVFLFCIKL